MLCFFVWFVYVHRLVVVCELCSCYGCFRCGCDTCLGMFLVVFVLVAVSIWLYVLACVWCFGLLFVVLLWVLVVFNFCFVFVSFKFLCWFMRVVWSCSGVCLGGCLLVLYVLFVLIVCLLFLGLSFWFWWLLWC